ncbi:MAG: Hsp20/alpha crystallin family protein [Syntrophales bacterium]|jgi:HSP20 family molecular chaperone IbpA|nr:Hsp20/alpha crystallin family protein [Syntrophales bacterium]
MKNIVEYEKKPVREAAGVERTQNRRVYVPKVDIIDTKESVILYADMPGVDEGSVDVTIDKNVLNISGVVKPPEFEGRSIAYAEYDTGDYDRSFTISDDIDREKVEALVKNGVLRLVLHKAPEAAVKKITVRAE